MRALAASPVPDMKYVFSGSDDSTVRVWDATTFACVCVFEGHEVGGLLRTSTRPTLNLLLLLRGGLFRTNTRPKLNLLLLLHLLLLLLLLLLLFRMSV